MNDLFRQQVYEITRLIPKGRVSTYGAVARAVGYPNHSRHVGQAMGGCPKDVPAHRVISSTGKLSVPSFKERLEKENVTIQDNWKVQDFKTLFWDPMKEL
ncbi:MAG: MGMT family protein [Chryseobacterium sp.]|nr:MAG: MGMT family protein [Chryseobacterium sp.]